MATRGMRTRVGKLEGAARLLGRPLHDSVYQEWRAWYEPMLSLLQECGAPAEVIESVRRPVEINENALFGTDHVPAPIGGVDGRVWWLRQTALHHISRAMGLSYDQWNAAISGQWQPDSENSFRADDPIGTDAPPPLEV